MSDVETSADWYSKVFDMVRLPVTFAHHEREETGHAVLVFRDPDNIQLELYSSPMS